MDDITIIGVMLLFPALLKLFSLVDICSAVKAKIDLSSRKTVVLD